MEPSNALELGGDGVAEVELAVQRFGPLRAVVGCIVSPDIPRPMTVLEAEMEIVGIPIQAEMASNKIGQFYLEQNSMEK